MANYRFYTVTSGNSSQLIVNTSLNENVSEGDVLRSKVAGAHGLVEKADDSGVQAVGVAMATGTIGTSIDVLYQGTQQVNFVETLTSSDIGKRVYVSATRRELCIRLSFSKPPNDSDIRKELSNLNRIRN